MQCGSVIGDRGFGGVGGGAGGLAAPVETGKLINNQVIAQAYIGWAKQSKLSTILCERTDVDTIVELYGIFIDITNGGVNQGTGALVEPIIGKKLLGTFKGTGLIDELTEESAYPWYYAKITVVGGAETGVYITLGEG